MTIVERGGRLDGQGGGTVRASLLQMRVDESESVQERRLRASALVREQAGADLVVLPELWTTGAFAFEDFDACAEPLTGPTHDAMSAAARDAGVWLHAGSIPERAGDGTLFNTALVFAPSGELAASYRKIHRFGFDRGEAVLMGAGGDLVTVELPGTTLGLATCYDLRFPELFRGLVDMGAQTLVVPAGWPERRRAHWTLLARARAVENQCFVLACWNGGDARGSSAGGSLDRGGSVGRGPRRGRGRGGGPHRRPRPGARRGGHPREVPRAQGPPSGTGHARPARPVTDARRTARRRAPEVRGTASRCVRVRAGRTRTRQLVKYRYFQEPYVVELTLSPDEPLM
ncbi:putative amidohydrolase [Streptomyces sp. MJP52]|nr:putative amidohydrolase [Streptomyces sp. MJP52]